MACMHKMRHHLETCHLECYFVSIGLPPANEGVHPGGNAILDVFTGVEHLWKMQRHSSLGYMHNLWLSLSLSLVPKPNNSKALLGTCTCRTNH